MKKIITMIVSLFSISLLTALCTSKKSSNNSAALIFLNPPAKKSMAQQYFSTEVANTTETGKYKIVDTNQDLCFDNTQVIPCPTSGDFYGQDGNFTATTTIKAFAKKPSYTLQYPNGNDGNGTLTIDQNTGLTWEYGYRVMTYDDAITKLTELNQNIAEEEDKWRLPTIKQLYSIMDFSGTDPSSNESKNPKAFLDTKYFAFAYGTNGSRNVDTQLLSSTIYKGRTMGMDETVFGLNVADGRIKGYPLLERGTKKKFTVRFVKGNLEYGKNNFKVKDHSNGTKTVIDRATKLEWMHEDSKKGMNWKQALAYAQEKNAKRYLGHSDWRLPNAKELHSILDYTRSPQQTNSAAIDSKFEISTITNEGGKQDYPFFWTSTTHKSADSSKFAKAAVYIAFGEALGNFIPDPTGAGLMGLGLMVSDPTEKCKKNSNWIDVHGAGAQRSDTKTGPDNKIGFGPQCDVERGNSNYVRLVRNADSSDLN